MYWIISFVAIFAIILIERPLVRAEVDMEVMEPIGKSVHEHYASLAEIPFQSDVESIPLYNAATSNHSGNLYFDNGYYGSLDQYPEQSNYDYSE